MPDVFPHLSAKPITRAVYYNDIPVGTICCRIETKDNTSHLYLLTMGVLAVRPDCCSAHGFGADSFLAISISWHRFIYLRCHLASCCYSYETQNLSHISPRPSFKPGRAKQLYERHGFRESGINEGYYKKITPSGAWVLERDIQSLEGEQN